MKKIIAFAAIVLYVLQARAQVKFEQISLDDAISKAAFTGKIVFAQFVHEGCMHCNEVADKAFAEEALGKMVATKCIGIKIELTDPDRAEFIQRFNPNKSLGTFFISGDGELLHVYPKTVSRGDMYITEINSAYGKIIEGQATLKELDREWNENPANIYAMEKNMEKRRAVGLPTDSLLDVYTKRLPPDSFTSLRTLQFIWMQAPAVYSEAHKKVSTNRELFSKLWSSFTPIQHADIRRRITNKTIAKAIKLKDEKIAILGAAFYVLGNPNNLPPAKQKLFDRLLLDYHIGIKDTVTYIAKAIKFFEEQLLPLDVDSVKKKDISAITDQLPNLKREPADPKKPKQIAYKLTTSFAIRSQAFQRELNHVAWIIYSYSANAPFLNFAERAARKANEFFGTPEVMDTYARILYRLGKKEEAIKNEEKAIALTKVRKYSTANYEKALAQMQNGEMIGTD